MDEPRILPRSLQKQYIEQMKKFKLQVGLLPSLKLGWHITTHTYAHAMSKLSPGTIPALPIC